jgi:hypothetical protein
MNILSTRRLGALPACVLVSASLLVSGCKDKAEPDLQRCEQLDKEGKLEEALLACQAARAADPSSAAGELATKREIKLLDKVAAARKAKVAEDAAQAEQAKLEAAEAKVNFMLESTPPKDPKGHSERCMAADRAYENGYACVPKDPSEAKADDPFPFKDECMLVAARKGCKPLDADNPSKLFCCTK